MRRAHFELLGNFSLTLLDVSAHRALSISLVIKKSLATRGFQARVTLGGCEVGCLKTFCGCSSLGFQGMYGLLEPSVRSIDAGDLG